MTAATAHARPPLWRNLRFLRAAAQVVCVAAAVALLLYLLDNLRAQLENRGIETGFDFLDQPLGFPIPYSDLRSSQPVSDGFKVAAKNTLQAAVVGIALATVLGIVVGVGRLSANWLVRKAAAIYVEVLRNIPPLLIILFVNNAVLLQLPPVGEAIEVGTYGVISNGELAVAAPVTEDGAGAWLLVLALVALAAGLGWRWRGRVQDRTGEPARRLVWVVLPAVALAVASYFLVGGPVTLSRPAVEGFQIVGGAAMNLPYVAVTLALALYTSSHIAEIVRGSILAVPSGQTEAATALGLRPVARLRHVVLPQAFRIAIPPTVNQYLNLTKNTSLGIAVAYAELTTFTFIAIGNGQPAPQMVFITMAIYLSFSIVISIMVNLYGRRLRYASR